MPASFEEILYSKPLRFFVGKNIDGVESECFVHQEVIAQLSQPLQAKVKGKYSSASILWPDVGKGTFGQFAQFAYTGDYTVPEPRKCPVPHVPIEDTIEDAEDAPSQSTLNGVHAVGEGEDLLPEEPPAPTVVEEEITDGASVIRKKKGKKTRTFFFKNESTNPVPEPEQEPIPLPLDFPSLSFTLLAPRNIHYDTCEPGEQFDPSQHYSNVFLCHAKLWALADTYEIAALKALALFKLHKSLCVFEVRGRNGSEVITLVRYAYSKEGLGQDRPDDPEEGLRGLVARYMAANAFVLSRQGGFMLLLGEGGQFAQDFVRLVVQGRY